MATAVQSVSRTIVAAIRGMVIAARITKALVRPRPTIQPAEHAPKTNVTSASGAPKYTADKWHHFSEWVQVKMCAASGTSTTMVMTQVKMLRALNINPTREVAGRSGSA